MRALAGILALTAIAGPAFAADLAVKAPPAAAPVYNWTGFYVGINGGYAWGQQDPFNAITDRFDKLSANVGGGTFGGTAGAQIQVSRVVLGLETDLDWANISGSTTAAPTIFGVPAAFVVNASTKIDWMATLRARAGVALDNWLVYATAGAAVMDNKSNLSTVVGTPCGTLAVIGGTPGILNCSGTSKRAGAVLGAGVEYGFTPNWSVKVEYLYFAAASLEVMKANEIRAGINYRFGGL